MNERELLYELFIPALRYYLPRRSISALMFPDVCKRVWGELTENDRHVAVSNITAELDNGEMWSTERKLWREFLEWAEKEA